MYTYLFGATLNVDTTNSNPTLKTPIHNTVTEMMNRPTK